MTIQLDQRYTEIKATVIDAFGREMRVDWALNSDAVAAQITGRPGVYYVHILADGKRKTFKVIKSTP